MADEEWTLKTSPEEYLEKYGADAPNSDLAKKMVGEEVTEAPPAEVSVGTLVEELRAEWAEVHREVERELLRATGEKADDLRVRQYREQTSTSIGRDIRKLSFRLNRPKVPREKVSEAVDVLRGAIARVAELGFGENLYEDDSHDVVLEAQR